MIKRLKPLNPLLSCFLVKNSNSIANLRPKSFRFYNQSTKFSSSSYNNGENDDDCGYDFGYTIDFTPESIELIRDRLKSSGKLNYKFTYDTTKKIEEAAVLMPLCVVDGKPSVLFTIRSLNLKTHTGEVSFPGGKKESTDASLESTALRETCEEIGISPSQIDVLGKDSTLPNKDRTIKVYPFVGFIKHPIDIKKVNFNKDEVYGVFSVTLKDLLNKDKRRLERFRDSKIKYPIFETPKEIGLEIWGLTAFILESACITQASESSFEKK
ncbi:11331_t:CDS:2 [Funneliformis geosporum]|uniref:11331_t:CDS:1 n=1 Tax=Funneliformis geosporum TaxID=1117311 RepID=A0A9W4WMB1_9GLOM|nr:11331_t:CDS:2 [Funneliformis geosporum]